MIPNKPGLSLEGVTRVRSQIYSGQCVPQERTVCRSCKSQRSKGITDALGDRQSREEVAYYPAVCTLKPFFSSLGKEWRKEWSPRSSVQGRILDPRDPGMILQETGSWNLGCPDWGPTEEKKAKTLEEDIIGAGDTTWKRQDTRSQS